MDNLKTNLGVQSFQRANVSKYKLLPVFTYSENEYHVEVYPSI